MASLNKIQTVTRASFKVCDSLTLESGAKVPVITGRVSVKEEVSGNGYRYRSDFWDKIVNDPRFQQQVSDREVLGTIEHPLDDDSYLRTPYEDASHIILKAWTQNGEPYASFGLLNNDKGNAIKALIDVGHKPGASTRGLGDISEDETSQYISPDGFTLITWDIVKSPNFPSVKLERVSDSLMSNPIFKELVDMHKLKDSMDTSYNRKRLLDSMESAISALIEVKNNLSNNYL